MTTLTPDQQLLFDLVSTRSITGNERTASECFVSHAQARGFEAAIDEVNNAIAHRGEVGDGVRTHIVLLGHIDTVPGDIPARIEKGTLHGRGSVDAKGPLCAMLCAAERAELPQGVKVSVIGAVGEESADSPGAHHIRDRLNPDACIIGEPSGWDGVTIGYKGRLLLTATATIDCHHSAGPDSSAGDLVIHWWSRVLVKIEQMNKHREGVFSVIQSTVRSMRSSSDGLVDTASIEAGFRLPPGIEPEALANELASLANPGIFTFSRAGSEDAYKTDRCDPVVRALSAAIRENGGHPRPKLKTGTADLNVVGPVWGCPIAAYGPGNSALDHTPHEHIILDEYECSIKVLTSAINRLAEEL
ncbi:MAG: [LysW]-lysine hydrolase [Phycisphaerales bacterium JB043]